MLLFCGGLRGSTAKNGFHEESVPVVTGILGKANSHFDSIQTGLETAPQREVGDDWCRQEATRASPNVINRIRHHCQKVSIKTESGSNHLL